MLSLLKKILEALASDPNSEIVAFYTHFSKAFNKVPHYELIQKVTQIHVGGCLLEIFIKYLENRKYYLRIDNFNSKTPDVTSGVHQGSLLSPLLFCLIIDDLRQVSSFYEAFIFADNLKILSTETS